MRNTIEYPLTAEEILDSLDEAILNEQRRLTGCIGSIQLVCLYALRQYMATHANECADLERRKYENV